MILTRFKLIDEVSNIPFLFKDCTQAKSYLCCKLVLTECSVCSLYSRNVSDVTCCTCDHSQLLIMGVVTVQMHLAFSTLNDQCDRAVYCV